MDFWDLTTLILRRWKISLPLLLVAIGMTVFVGMTAKPDYTMTSYVQLIPARVAPTDDPAGAALRNPWNQLGLNTLGQASIYATQDQQFLDQLKAGKHTDNLTLTLTYPNPIITVEVVGSSQQDARETTQLVIDRLQRSVEALQRGSGVGSADIIATQRLDQGLNLQPTRGKMKRAMAAVAAVGLALIAGGTVGFDAFVRRRSRKREDREPAESPSQVPAELPDQEVFASPSNVPVATAGLDDPPGGRRPAGVLAADSAEPAAPPIRAAVFAPDRTAPLQRTAKVIKRSSLIKSQRPPVAAVYRSANAQGEATGDDHDAAPLSTDNAAASAEVRIVLPPERTNGEDKGKVD